MRRPLALAAALVALCAVAVALAEPTLGPASGPFLPLAEPQLCYHCHTNWTPPLKAMAVVLPPATTGAAVGAEFNYTVTFQQSWNPKPSVPELVFVDPVLDIAGAPSLRFVGDHPDVHGYTESHTIVVDDTKPTVLQENVTRIAVPAGATSLRWTVRPKDTSSNGPDIALVVRPPGGNGTKTVDVNHTAGSQEVVSYSAEALQAMGAGNWTIGAAITPVASPSAGAGPLPSLTRVDFQIVEDAAFDTASLKGLAFPSNADVKGGGTVLQTWHLKFVAAPGPGEQVMVGFNSTSYFQHDPPVTGGDYGNIVNTVAVVPACVDAASGQPALCYTPQNAVAVRPLPVNGPTLTTVSEAIGYASAFLLISSIVSGGMFGQASRRGLNAIFQSAKRRVAFHNFLSYGLTVAALGHMSIFLFRITQQYQWTLGIIWGGAAILSMLGLGVTGALQVPMIRRWSYGTWKWWHYGLTIAAIAFTVVHMLLDGAHFPEVQESLGWKDPFYNPTVTV